MHVVRRLGWKVLTTPFMLLALPSVLWQRRQRLWQSCPQVVLPALPWRHIGIVSLAAVCVGLAGLGTYVLLETFPSWVNQPAIETAVEIPAWPSSVIQPGDPFPLLSEMIVALRPYCLGVALVGSLMTIFGHTFMGMWAMGVGFAFYFSPSVFTMFGVMR